MASAASQVGGSGNLGHGAGFANPGNKTTRTQKPAGDKSNGDDPPKKKVDRPVNFKRKAEAKINAGRSTITDSRYWARIIEEDLRKPDPSKCKVWLGSHGLSDHPTICISMLGKVIGWPAFCLWCC